MRTPYECLIFDDDDIHRCEIETLIVERKGDQFSIIMLITIGSERFLENVKDIKTKLTVITYFVRSLEVEIDGLLLVMETIIIPDEKRAFVGYSK